MSQPTFQSLPELSQDIIRSVMRPEADRFARLAVLDWKAARESVEHELRELNQLNPGLAQGVREATQGILELYEAYIWPVESMVLETWLLKSALLLCRGLDHALWASKMAKEF